LSGSGQYNFQDELQDEIPIIENLEDLHGEDSEDMEGNEEEPYAALGNEPESSTLL